MSAIEAEHLGRTFNGKPAVTDLTFAVPEGEIFGFLGPNGAGKTTTIRMLTGQIQPTSGHAAIMGNDVQTERERVRALIGVVFESQNLYERMSARDNLLFSARLYGVPARRVDELLERIGLAKRAAESVQKYSNGMKQRVLIARALLHNPRVLFLDEPTRGLDPDISLEIRRLVHELAEQGTTVFLTTHYMEEADTLCRHVAFLNQGRIVALDTPERLKVHYGQRKMNITLNDGRQLALSLVEPTDGQKLSELVAAGSILTAHSAEASLEDVFIQLVGRSLAQ